MSDMLSVGFCFRVDVRAHRGGDVIQIENTLEAARRLSLFDGEIVDSVKQDWHRFDIINFTNLDRPVDFFLFYKSIVKSGFSGGLVLSSIHHSYQEIETFERVGRKAKFSPILGRLGFFGLELLRSFIRSKKHPELFLPSCALAFRGVRSIQRTVLRQMSAVVVLSEKEARDISRDFLLVPEALKFRLVRNAFPSPTFQIEDVQARVGIACIGRIEPRKNQLMIMDALQGLGHSVVFVGALNGNSPEYCAEFLRRVKESNGMFVYEGTKSGSEIHKILRRSVCHVSASWFEVASLVDLEAAACGAWVVSSKCGSSDEVISERIALIDPSDQASLRKVVLDVLSKAAPSLSSATAALPSRTWDDVARDYFQIYSAI
jgi:glycosyltransferase involved in cell wall biosynthesis